MSQRIALSCWISTPLSLSHTTIRSEKETATEAVENSCRSQLNGMLDGRVVWVACLAFCFIESFDIIFSFNIFMEICLYIYSRWYFKFIFWVESVWLIFTLL